MTMNKNKLQQELLAKIKPGTKPSDLKKKKLVNPKIDEGYSSEEEEKIIPTKKEKELQKQANY